MADLPDNCMGNEQSTRCIVYDKTGEPLDDVIERLESSDLIEEDEASIMTSDEVITKSLVRNPAALCSSKIVNRGFTYTVSATKSTSSVSWDLTELIRNLPSDYTVSSVRVKATGTKEGTSSVLADSNKVSAGFSLGLDRYPATVDFTVRVNSPCGNIDLYRTITIASPTKTGTYRLVMNAQDLSGGIGTDLTLTDQLDGLEAQVSQLSVNLSTYNEISIGGDIKDVNSAFVQQQSEIDDLESKVSDPSSFQIGYEKDGSTEISSLTAIITDLYAEIQDLKDRVTQNEIDISGLQSEGS